ncbi:MAG: hypothetical protein M1370_04065 [Bacteroidetes bacterium]|nr:hypothetical protein [Bacteroidota bacterium]MCL5026384.1 hypothetical protein [Chloroflexota bacterium]
MSQELGRMEKPAAESFGGTRKLCLVPLLFAPPDSPEDFAALFERYWSGVQKHLTHLTSRLGTVRRVYHEAISATGDTGLKAIQALNGKSYEVVKAALDSGAEIVAVEDEELTREAFDWQRCLLSGLTSQRVARLAYDSFQEATRKRYEHIAQRIDETLQPDEVGLLFIQENHRVQFPADIQVFYVAPPALDDIHRWLREHAEKEAQA